MSSKRYGHESSFSKTITSSTVNGGPTITNVTVNECDKDLGTNRGHCNTFNDTYCDGKKVCNDGPNLGYGTFGKRVAFNVNNPNIPNNPRLMIRGGTRSLAPRTRENPINAATNANVGIPKLNLYVYGYDPNKTDVARHRALNKACLKYGPQHTLDVLTSMYNRHSYRDRSKPISMYSKDMEYLRKKCKEQPHYGNNIPIIPFRLVNMVDGKDLVFSNGEKISECDIGNIESDFIDYQSLAKLILINDPNDIITVRYGGDLKGICILNDYGDSCLVVNAFAVSRGFRSPFIKFLKMLRSKNYNSCSLLIADKRFPTFWSKYNFGIAHTGNPIFF